jgi:hypothetical protein
MARLSTDGANKVVVGTNHASIKESREVLAALDEVIEKTRRPRR